MTYARGETHIPSIRRTSPLGRVSVVFEPIGATRAVVPGGWRRRVSLMRASVKGREERRVCAFGPRSWEITLEGWGLGPKTEVSSSAKVAEAEGWICSS